jgi:RNA polymerase sigma-70 factor, ECF subfamily
MLRSPAELSIPTLGPRTDPRQATAGRSHHRGASHLSSVPIAPGATVDVSCTDEDSDQFLRRMLAAHGAAITAYARRLSGDADTAEDLVQEALIRAWQNADKLDEKVGSIRGWLLTVVRNLDVDRRRAKSARPLESLAAPGGLGLEAAEDVSRVVELRTVEDRIVLEDLLDLLPVTERQVMVELYLRDRTVTEAARALQLPAGTVKSRSFSALRRLRGLVSAPEAA